MFVVYHANLSEGLLDHNIYPMKRSNFDTQKFTSKSNITLLFQHAQLDHNKQKNCVHRSLLLLEISL